MEEPEVVLGDHVPAIHTHAGDLQGGPDRIAAEKLVVGGNAGELHHSELQHQVVDQFLRLLFRQGPFVKVPLDVDIEEGGNPADAHCRAVLALDCGQVAEIEPLHSLPGIGRRKGDVEVVALGHLLDLIQSPDLLGDFLPAADDVIGHRAVTIVGKVVLLLLDEAVDAVQCDPAVVTDDAASPIRVGKPRDDMGVARHAHLWRVCIEHRLIVGLVVFREHLVEQGIRLVAVGGASLLGHPDAAIRHEGPFQGLVGL